MVSIVTNKWFCLLYLSHIKAYEYENANNNTKHIRYHAFL